MDVNEYPTPIAASYQAAHLTLDQQLKFRSLIRAFGVILKYCSLLAISDYIR